MKWLQYIENPESIKTLFNSIPTIDELEVVSLKLDREGPIARFVFHFSGVPDKPPKKWESTWNMIQLEMSAYPITRLAVSSWSTLNIGELRIIPLKNNQRDLEVSFQSESCNFSLAAQVIRVSAISGFKRG